MTPWFITEYFLATVLCDEINLAGKNRDVFGLGPEEYALRA